jgi:hypothetical protein
MQWLGCGLVFGGILLDMVLKSIGGKPVVKDEKKKK